MNIQTIKTNPIMRLLSSWYVRVLLVLVVLVAVMGLTTSGVSVQVKQTQEQFLTDAVRRSAVQCYALEGRFPEDLAYLEDKYGLYYDKQDYVVYYESMGDNLIPQIRVLSVER